MNTKITSAVAKAGLMTLVLLTVVGLTPSLNPGVVFEIETTYHSGTEPRVESAEMSVEGEMLKMEILPSEEDAGEGAVKDEVVFNGERKEMIVIDHERKSYMVMDEATVEEMGRALGEAADMIQNMQIPKAVLDQMPEEERKKLEEMLKQQREQGGVTGSLGGGTIERPKREYKRTGERGTKEGYPCVKYDVLEDGEKVQELWVTDWDNVDGGDEVEAAFRALADFFEEIMDAFDDMLGGDGGLFEGGNDPFSGFMELDGIPVISRDFEDGDLESESVLKSARRQRLDPAAFEPPSGYKRMSMGPR